MTAFIILVSVSVSVILCMIYVCLVAEHEINSINHYLGNNLKACLCSQIYICYEKQLNTFVSLCRLDSYQEKRGSNYDSVWRISGTKRERRQGRAILHSQTICCSVSYHHTIFAGPLRAVSDTSAHMSYAFGPLARH